MTAIELPVTAVEFPEVLLPGIREKAKLIPLRLADEAKASLAAALLLKFLKRR